MNNTLKIGLLAASVGIALHSGAAEAAVANHSFISNSVNYCQAFTPGVTNTVRNRVVGAENVGSNPIAVACNFHTMFNGAAGITPPTSITMWFANNNVVGDLMVTCTLLTGWQGQGGTSQYAVTKTTTAIPSGGTAQRSLTWATADNPNAGATSLGNYRVGINCTLPQGAVMNDSVVNWPQDNGV